MATNFLKRAGRRLIRRPVQSAIHIALYSVVLTLMLSGLMIESAAAGTVDKAKRDVGAVATMAFDVNAYLEHGGTTSGGGGATPRRLDIDATVLNVDDLEKVCSDAVVVSCNFSTNSGAFPTEGFPVYSPSGPSAGAGGANALDMFDVEGVRASDQLSEFRNGDARIIEGSGITPGDRLQILIDKRLAAQNGISVGDIVQLYVGQLAPEGGLMDDQAHEFEVAGIYETDDTDAPAGSPAMMQPANVIYATLDAAGLLLGAGGGGIEKATFTLSDPDDLKALAKRAEASGIDTRVFPLGVNDKRYRQLVGPIEQTAAFANVVVWGALIGGALILALVVASSFRARRREVGVLLSLGESKTRVLAQQFIELAACAVLAVGIATGVSQLVGPAIGNLFLSGQIASAQEQGSEREPDPSSVGGGLTPAEEVDPISSIDVGLHLAEIGLLGAASLAITALAVALPGVRLARQHPRDILTKEA